MRDTFQRLEDAWADAILRGDVEAVEEILSDDFVLTSEGGVGPKMPREDWLAAMPAINTRSLTCSVGEVRTYGSAAVVRGRLLWEATMGDRDLSGEYVVADVFTKADDRWRVAWRISVRLSHA